MLAKLFKIICPNLDSALVHAQIPHCLCSYAFPWLHAQFYWHKSACNQRNLFILTKKKNPFDITFVQTRHMVCAQKDFEVL